MFHPGDLQSGISRAIAEQKLVACFIRSDNDESQKWEQQWLGVGKEPAPIDKVALKAVILRIDYGSTEMGFLGAFCPVASSPAFIVIDKGQVLDKIESGVGQEEFMTRVSKALDSDMHVINKSEYENARAATQQQTQIQEQQDEVPQESSSSAVPAQEAGDASTSNAVAESSESTQPARTSLSTSPGTTNNTPSSNMQTLFPDRAQRHEEEKLRREAAEKAERTARATARRKEAEEAAAAAGTTRDKGKGKAGNTSEQEKSRRDWLAQQKQRKDEDKKDRERILRQIEADKQERKARAQREKVETGPSESLLTPSADAASRRRSGPGSMCSLQIRLFDGSSIKGRFEPSSTLAGTVRDWIKTTTAEQGNIEAADVPFTFKQIMAPQPSRNIEISEEHQSLLELGLSPSATLVLAPIAGYTDAYSGTAGRGYMSSALHYTYSAVSTTTSLLGSALSYVPGFGSAPSPTGAASSRTSHSNSEDSSSVSNLDGTTDASTGRGFKVKTLADQRAEAEKARRQSESAEFYNGNSSAFEGRKDDDKKD